MNVQALTLDLSKKSETTPIVRIGQGDKNGTTIRATIRDNGEIPDLSGATVKLRIKLPRDVGYYEKTGTRSGSVATFAVNESSVSLVSGITDICYVEVTKNGATTSTERFRVVIEKSARV